MKSSFQHTSPARLVSLLLLPLLGFLLTSCGETPDYRAAYQDVTNRLLDQAGTLELPFDAPRSMEHVLNAAQLFDQAPELSAVQKLARRLEQDINAEKEKLAAAEDPGDISGAIYNLSLSTYALLGAKELEKKFLLQYLSADQNKLILSTLEFLHSKASNTSSPPPSAAQLSNAALSALFAKGASLALCPMTYSDEFYDKTLAGYSDKFGFYDPQRYYKQQPLRELIILEQLARRKQYLPEHNNISADKVKSLLQHSSNATDAASAAYFSSAFYNIATGYDINEPIAVAVDLRPYIKKLEGENNLSLEDKANFYQALAGNKLMLAVKDDREDLKYVEVLPSPVELARKFKAAPGRQLTEFLLQSMDILLSNTYIESNNKPVSEFLTCKRTGCRGFVNYYLEFFKNVGIQAYPVTLFNYPSQNQAHSILVFEYNQATCFLLSDSGLLIVKDNTGTSQQYTATIHKYSRYLQSQSTGLHSRYTQGPFDWAIAEFDPQNYKNSHIPFGLDFQGVKEYTFGNKDLRPNESAWHDMAYGRSGGSGPIINERAVLDNGSIREDFAANLFVLGSMGIAYQPKFTIKNFDKGIRVTYIFSATEEPEFKVEATVEGGEIAGAKDFLLSYKNLPYPASEGEATWEFEIFPTGNEKNIVLYINCPGLTADGQKLFVDSLIFKNMH